MIDYQRAFFKQASYYKHNLIEQAISKHMKPFGAFVLLILFIVFDSAFNHVNPSADKTKDIFRIILIPHVEKPDNGDNLSCQEFNRSLQLPNVIYARFGISDDIYVPASGVEKATKNSRMLETIKPFAVKYNLKINTSFDVGPVLLLAQELKTSTCAILIVWEHDDLPDIAKDVGISSQLNWKSDNFDTIWNIDIRNGKSSVSAEQENISPSENYSF